MGGLIWIIVMIVVIKEIRKFQGKNAPAAECAAEPDGGTAERAPESDAGTADAERRRGCHGGLPQTSATAGGE